MAKTQTQNAQPGNYNAAAVTLVDGAPGSLQLDVNGNLKTIQVASASDGYNYTHIAAGQATTVIKARKLNNQT